MVNEETQSGQQPAEGQAAPAEGPAAGGTGAPAIPRAADVLQADQRPAIAVTRRRSGEVSRRGVLAGGFWGGLGVTTLGLLGATLKFIWPEKVKGFGGTFVITPDRLPRQGEDPVRILEAKAWVANLAPGQGGFGEFGEGAPSGGILAMWQKCPHLGCTVPWLPGFDYGGETGWFRCPCHQSTYTRAGIRVFGPAPRPMDTFDIHFDSEGRLVINTGKITLGGEDNALRAIPAPF